MYTLISENITLLVSTSPVFNWWKNFYHLTTAKLYAENDYLNHGGRQLIKWHRTTWDWSSQDLGFVIYRIRPLAFEDADNLEVVEPSTLRYNAGITPKGFGLTDLESGCKCS